jgi:hypothetical protein
MAEGSNKDPDKKKPWKEAVIEAQQFFYEVFGDRDWDRYNESEMEFLERNVGHAMFGPPKELPDDEKNGSTGSKLLIDCLFVFFLIHPLVFFCITNKLCTLLNTML